MYNALGKRWRERQGEVSFNAYPAIASHVTADARLRLADYLRYAGREHVYYVDTDSLIVDNDGFAALSDFVDSSKLGYLKLEGVANEIFIRAPKDYAFGAEEHMKGVSHDAQRLGSNVFRQQQWPGLLQGFARGHWDRVLTVPVTKTLDRTISSGVVRGDGSVEPYHLWISDGETVATNDPRRGLLRPFLPPSEPSL